MGNILNADKAKDIGKIIEAERKRKGWKDAERLAEELNTTRQTVRKWEKGESSPTLYDLLKMCELFDCDFGYLVGEYSNKRRVDTDVYSELGLDQQAIDRLRNLRYASSHGTPVMSEYAEQYIKLYSALISDLRIAGMLDIYLSKISALKSGEMGESDRELFADYSEAIRFYEMGAAQEIMRFLDDFISNYEIEGD